MLQALAGRLYADGVDPDALTPEQSGVLTSPARSWDAIREGNDSFGRGDLEKIVGDDPPDLATDEIKATARYLLERPGLLKYRLDIADKSGKPDGKVSEGDVAAPSPVWISARSTSK